MEIKAIRTRGIYVMLTLLLAAVTACTTASALALANSANVLELLKDSMAVPQEGTQEDDVTINSTYVVRSTKNLSDAYKSGDTSALDDKQKETLDMASAVIKEIITDTMTDFEKEKAVYDWMTHELRQDRGLLTVIPTSQADCDNPYGALKYHNAVCVGYATTFRLFMEMLDIPCMVVHNTGLFHTWNLVQLDGEWYHTDIYSDVGSGNYNNFNMSDEMLSKHGQEWDTTFYPSAANLKYNMASRNAAAGCDVHELPALLRAAIDGNTSMLSFKYGRDFTEHQARAISEAADQVCSLLWNITQYNGIGFEYYFYPVEDGYLFVVNFSGLDQISEETRLTEEEREKITKEVNSTFADLTGWVDESEME